jgi:hypothetical protein
MFLDPDFRPSSGDALYWSEFEYNDNIRAHKREWHRVSSLDHNERFYNLPDGEVTLFGTSLEPLASHIKQGFIPDCYFLAAL